MKRKGVVLLISVSLLTVLLCLRISYVNSDVLTIPVENHSIDEWVELDGAFHELDDENTQGYSVRIKQAKAMPYQEFLKIYGGEKEYLDEGIQPKTVLDIEYEFRNDGNSDGYILLIQYIAEGKSYSLNFNSKLWALCEPAGKGNIVFTVKENTTYSFHVPYVFAGNFNKDLAGEELGIVVSRLPTKKVINIKVQ